MKLSLRSAALWLVAAVALLIAAVPPLLQSPVTLALAAVCAVVIMAALSAVPARARKLAYYHSAKFAYGLRAKLGEWLFAGLVFTGGILRAFPSTVGADLGFGVVGELAFDGPFRSQPARINHGTAADIVVGRWFTLAADGSCRPGGAGAIGGICMAPKTMSSAGGANGPVSPTLTLLTGTIAELGYMGAFIVSVGAAVALGNAAWYDTTTGAIGVGAPGAGQAAIPNAKFIRYANAAAGLAVLELTN